MRPGIAVSCLVAISAALADLTASPGGRTLKLEARDGRPTVAGVFVNDRGPYRFLVDTGATFNHIDRGLAMSIGLTATFQTKLVSAAGVTVTGGHSGSSVRLGAVSAGQQTFLFGGIDALHELSPDLQGILGQSFLSNFDYLLDLEGGQLRFDEPAPAVPGVRLTFTNAQGRPVISTSLGALILDSGARGVVRFGVNPTRRTTLLITASGSLNVGTVWSQLEIGGKMFWRGEAVALPDSPERGADGLLPIQMFKSIYVSNSQRYVILR